MDEAIIERIARAIKWARIKDEPASTDYITGTQKFMRDITSEDACYLEELDLIQARAAIAAYEALKEQK